MRILLYFGVVFLNGAGWSTPKRHHTLEVNIICTEGTAFEIQRHRFPSAREKTVVPSALARSFAPGDVGRRS
jgi:hypothetical protein